MRNLCMVVSYDGTSYHGFQTQPQKNTIQDKIEEALALLTGEKILIISSGRTDAKVHARAQIFNFITSSPIPVRSWGLAINTILPNDIVVLHVKEVPMEFHARKGAKSKTYRYTINGNRFADVFHRFSQFHHPTYLNVDEMEKALHWLIGKHDFTSFCSRKSVKESHIRTISEAKIVREQQIDPFQNPVQAGVIHIYLTGNGFLYNMVRIIAGTLIEIGEGKKGANEMKLILEAEDRSYAGPTADAHGLTLWEVFY